MDEVPHSRNSTGQINIELPQQQPEGVYETIRETRNTEYERAFRNADSESEEHQYSELPQPPDNVYEMAVLNAEPQEPQYSELSPPLENVYEMAVLNAEPQEPQYSELSPPLENVYEMAVLNAEPQEPQYSELLPRLESVYETVGVAVEVPLLIYKSSCGTEHSIICSLHFTAHINLLYIL